MLKADRLLQELSEADRLDIDSCCADLWAHIQSEWGRWPDWGSYLIGTERFTTWLDRQSMGMP